MGFMEYSNKNQVNIIPQKEFEELSREVFGVISSNLTRSLGPLGSSATILDGALTEATKDGYHILMKYRFFNRYKKMIYNLIKAPCTRMNNTVGDGTTTGIALTAAMFDRYQDAKGKLVSMYRLPRQFTKAWDEVIEDICKRVSEKSKSVDPTDYDTIYNIAYVTSNGNREISEAFAKTYNEAKSPAIKMKDSPTNKSYIKEIDGFEFPANAIDVVYVRNQDLTAEETDVAIMIFDHKIGTDFFNKVLVPINEVLRAMGKKLIVIAPSYDEYMCDTVLRQYVNLECNKYGVINLILTQYRLGDLTPHQCEDLAVILRCKTINEQLADGLVTRFSEKNSDQIVEDIIENDKYDFYRVIGSAAKVFTSCKNGCIFNVTDIENDKEYQEAITRAKAELDAVISKTDFEKQSMASKVYEARSRLMQLEMKNYIYYVGADSELQKQIIWDSIDDVIKCLRSAIKYGVVPGCQLSIATSCEEAITDIMEEIKKCQDIEKEISYQYPLKIEIIGIIYNAVIDVYSTLLHGAEGLGMVKLIDGWNKNSDEYNKLDKAEDSEQDEVKKKELHEQKKKVQDEYIDSIKEKARVKAGEIIAESIKENKVFDLENLEYSDKIITSTETDIMVLKVASELVKILISGNQCIFLDSDVTESHQETMEI